MQITILSWVERVHIQVKCLAQRHSATLWQPRPVPKAFQSKVAGHSRRPMTPCMYMEYIFRCIGDTEGGHCQGVLGGSFTSYSMPVRRLRHSGVRASHERCTVSNVEGREVNLHKPLPRTTGIEPGGAAWQACTLPLALLLPSQHRFPTPFMYTDDKRRVCKYQKAWIFNAYKKNCTRHLYP